MKLVRWWCVSLRFINRTVFGAVVMAMFYPALARVSAAQDSKLGAYAGTVEFSGAEVSESRHVDIAAKITINMELTDREDSYAMALINDLETPSATALITRYDLAEQNSYPDSDGKITSWKCSLAAPTTVTMNAQGVLNINYDASTYSMYVALASIETMPLNCESSRSGPYKEDKGIVLFFGTNEPDAMPYTELPFKDASSLQASYKLVPQSYMKDSYGPVDFVWSFAFKK